MASNSLGQIDLQIMWNRLIAVVEEQAQTLMRTAFSSIVREAGDLSAGVFDLKGRMLAQAVTGTPGHVNSMAESVKHFIRHFPVETMKAGDIYITNDPWMGTGHTNDFVLTTPCFKNGRLVALFSCTSHIMDIGGIGFGPDATDVPVYRRDSLPPGSAFPGPAIVAEDETSTYISASFAAHIDASGCIVMDRKDA